MLFGFLWLHRLLYIHLCRTKLKQTEVDCDQLRKCCENLTEENRRLQKEVQELRALKLSPQLYMQMNPPTTLTMCPSCQCVGVSSSSSSSSAAASSTAPATGHPGQPTIHRPVPISPWATLPIPHHRPVDAPAPTSGSWFLVGSRGIRKADAWWF